MTGTTRALAMALGLLSAGTLVARSASAADPGAAAPLVAEGIEHFRQQDYEAARTAFSRAYALDPVPSTLMDLALAELQSGHPVDAVRHLRQFVVDPAAAPAKVAVVREKWLPRAEAETSRLAIDGPAGAEFLVDGVLYGALPHREPIDIGVGAHTVVVRADGWSRSSSVVTRAGETAAVHIEKPPDRSTPTTVPSHQPSAVNAPMTTPEASPQPHDMTQAKPPFWTTTRTVGVIVAGAGIASLISGFAFAAAASSAEDQANGLAAQLGPSGCTLMPASQQCSDLQSAHDEQSRDHTLNLVFVSVGAAAVAVGAVLFLLPVPKTQSRQPALAPMVAPGVAGLTLRGGF